VVAALRGLVVLRQRERARDFRARRGIDGRGLIATHHNLWPACSSSRRRGFFVLIFGDRAARRQCARLVARCVRAAVAAAALALALR